MSRIEPFFAGLLAKNKKALISFVTAGFPDVEITVPLLHTLVEAGADIIELGVPFSDPMADGPTIQRSSEKALVNGVTLKTVLAMAADFRKKNTKTPLVLMGYANPIEAMGREVFAHAAQAAGVDGVLTVDLPPEEAVEFSKTLTDCGIDPIFLLAPTSTSARVRRLAGIARGYVYYVSVKGVTGSGLPDAAEIGKRIPEIRAVTGLPVGVGFGIRDAETAEKIAAISDAVVVGSRIIEELERAPKGEELARVAALVRALRQGMDQNSR